MPSPAYLITMLQARADDDAETLAELRDVLADPEAAEALLEQVESGQDDDDQPPAVLQKADRRERLKEMGYEPGCPKCGGDYYYTRTDGPEVSHCKECRHTFDSRLNPPTEAK